MKNFCIACLSDGVAIMDIVDSNPSVLSNLLSLALSEAVISQISANSRERMSIKGFIYIP